MNYDWSRREMLRTSGLALGGFALSGNAIRAQSGSARGAIAGEATAARIGQNILDGGESAIDAILSAALVAAVVSPHNCGIGGYGGHMMIARADPPKIIAIDFNSIAPALARADMFEIDAPERVRERKNEFGWLAAGVPGTIAGIELAARHYGKRKFVDLLEPAIALAEEGFPVGNRLATAIRTNAARLKNDPGSSALYLPNGSVPNADDIHRNADLARLLRLLAAENSVEPFYRGPIAKKIADAFQRNGGLLSAADMAAYQAHEVEPYALQWDDFVIHTAPLTAGGLTVMQALTTLRALDWKKLPQHGKTHGRVEALRMAWEDRLALLGDPKFAAVPVEKLLSAEHATRAREKIRRAMEERKPVPVSLGFVPDQGTVHLSCSDPAGNLAALTLTHGGSFGAQVTVPGLGLTLGHGMSRFDPRPGHPNSIEPGKRPLHNMCPTIVTRGGKPVFAAGGAGGRKIPNAVYDVVLEYVTGDGSLSGALNAPRCHTVGDLKLVMENQWADDEVAHLESVGYQIARGNSALVSAAAFEPSTGQCRAQSR